MSENFYSKRAAELAEQINALRAEVEGYATRAEAEERDLTDAERADADAKLDEAEKLRAEHADAVARAQRLDEIAEIAKRDENLETGSQDEKERRQSVNFNTRTDPFDLDQLPHDRSKWEGELASRAETVIESHLPREISDSAREAATAVARRRSSKHYDAEQVNEFIIRSSKDAYIEAFEEYVRTNGTVRRPVLDMPLISFRTAMSLTAANGGVLVPQFLDPTIIMTNAGTNNVVRQLARNTKITVDQWDGVTSAGVTAEWLGEGSQVADATPTFVGPTITVHKGAAYAFASYEVLMDSGFNEIGMLFADAKDRLEETAFTTGTGSSQPYGLITRLSGTGPSVAGVGGDAGAATFSSADIYAVKNALGPRFRKNAVWQANPTILDKIRQFDTAGGGTFWTDLNTDIPPKLLGKGVYENEAMDSTIVSGSNDDVLLFGDHSAYNIVDRIGLELVYDPLVLGANARPTGQAGWFAFWRVGADVLTSNAFKLLRL